VSWFGDGFLYGCITWNFWKAEITGKVVNNVFTL
jgi:hypothetical protein